MLTRCFVCWHPSFKFWTWTCMLLTESEKILGGPRLPWPPQFRWPCQERNSFSCLTIDFPVSCVCWWYDNMFFEVQFKRKKFPIHAPHPQSLHFGHATEVTRVTAEMSFDFVAKSFTTTSNDIVWLLHCDMHIPYKEWWNGVHKELPVKGVLC